MLPILTGVKLFEFNYCCAILATLLALDVCFTTQLRLRNHMVNGNQMKNNIVQNVGIQFERILKREKEYAMKFEVNSRGCVLTPPKQDHLHLYSKCSLLYTKFDQRTPNWNKSGNAKQERKYCLPKQKKLDCQIVIQIWKRKKCEIAFEISTMEITKFSNMNIFNLTKELDQTELLKFFRWVTELIFYGGSPVKFHKYIIWKRWN